MNDFIVLCEIVGAFLSGASGDAFVELQGAPRKATTPGETSSIHGLVSLIRDELLGQSDRTTRGNHVSVLSALEPMSRSAVGPTPQILRNSLLSESQGERAYGQEKE